MVSDTTEIEDSLLKKKEYAVPIGQIELMESKMTTNGKKYYSNLFEKNHFAARFIPYLIPIAANPDGNIIISEIEFQQKSYPSQYIILHAYLFFTNPSMDETYFLSILKPLLTSKNIVFFSNEFRALLLITPQSVACIRKLRFYDILIKHLNQRTRESPIYRKFLKSFQVIMYNHLQKK
jgi:hypothetical protein